MTPSQVGIVGIVLAVGGTVTAGALVLSDPKSAPRRFFERYAERLDRYASFLFLKVNGTTMATIQIGAIGALLLLAGLFQNLLYLLAAILLAILPVPLLEARRLKRVEALEKQLPSWLLLLANALKATPSIPEAIEATSRLTTAPMQQELDLLVKELRLGSSLAVGISAMSDRIRSRTISAALSTILVGQRTGGDVPHILDQAAAGLREMARLEAVMRTKTAEGKAQMVLIATMPFVLIGGMYAIYPEWLAPLVEDIIGHVMIGVAIVAWVLAVVLARIILKFPGEEDA